MRHSRNYRNDTFSPSLSIYDSPYDCLNEKCPPQARVFDGTGREDNRTFRMWSLALSLGLGREGFELVL